MRGNPSNMETKHLDFPPRSCLRNLEPPVPYIDRFYMLNLFLLLSYFFCYFSSPITHKKFETVEK